MNSPNDGIKYIVRFGEDKTNFEQNAFNVYSFIGILIEITTVK